MDTDLERRNYYGIWNYLTSSGMHRVSAGILDKRCVALITDRLLDRYRHYGAEHRYRIYRAASNCIR